MSTQSTLKGVDQFTHCPHCTNPLKNGGKHPVSVLSTRYFYTELRCPACGLAWLVGVDCAEGTQTETGVCQYYILDQEEIDKIRGKNSV